MIKDWININNEEEFKKLGNFIYVRKLIKEDLNEFKSKNCITEIDILKVLHMTSNSIIGLVEKIKVIKTFVKANYINVEEKNDLEKNNSTDVNSDREYFKSEAHELIYYLIQLDGEERMDKLNIYSTHYHDKELAKSWYKDIAKKIHSDKLNNREIIGAEEAMSELTAIYKKMGKR